MYRLIAVLALAGGMLTGNSALACININKASVDQLRSVKGIGPARANAIIAHRNKHGDFEKVGDLVDVKGFGAKSVAKTRRQLCVKDGKLQKIAQKSDKARERRAKRAERVKERKERRAKHIEERKEKRAAKSAERARKRADRKAEKAKKREERKAKRAAKKAEKMKKREERKAGRAAKREARKAANSVNVNENGVVSGNVLGK